VSRAVSRSGLSVSMSTSTELCSGGSATVRVPLNLRNRPWILAKPRWTAVAATVEWMGSMCQIPGVDSTA